MNTRFKSLLAGAVAMLAVFGAGSALAERYYTVDLSIDACFANGTPDSVLQAFTTAYVVKASDLLGWDGTVGSLASVPKLFTQTLSKGANLQMSVSWSENYSEAWNSVRYGGEADYKAVVASENACFVVKCTSFYNDHWADYYASGSTWYYEGALTFSNASSPYVPAGLPIDVTLPVGTTGYGFAVSNLTDGVGIQPTVAGGTTYALPAGARVGIYAVPEPGYVVMGEPFFIKEVTAGMTINPSLLPKAIEAVVVESFAVSGGVARVGVKNPVAGFYYALKASDTPGGDYVLVMESITNAAAADAVLVLTAPASAARRFYRVLVSLDDPKQAALGGVQLWANGPYWAECNVGAGKPEDYGYYFWWGDTVGYKRNANNNGWVSAADGTAFTFSTDTCQTHGKSVSQLQSLGYIDSSGTLTAAHDAATAQRGDPWRMPTIEDFSNLIFYCDIIWTTRNGVNGWLVTGREAYASKSIFMPAGGYGEGSSLSNRDFFAYYWLPVMFTEDPAYAGRLTFSAQSRYMGDYFRYLGHLVRPVRDAK